MVARPEKSLGFVERVEEKWKHWGWKMRIVVLLIGAWAAAMAVGSLLFIWGKVREQSREHEAAAVATSAPMVVPAGPTAPPAATNYDNHGTNNGNIGPNGTVINNAPPPRRLPPDQIQKVADALRPYAGTRVNVFLYTSTGDEGSTLERQIVAAMTDAHWLVTRVSGKEYGEQRSDRPKSGLLIENGPRTDGGAAQAGAASALVTALTAAGLHPKGPRPYDAWARGAMEVMGTEDGAAVVQLTILGNDS